jgi:DNA-binding response OmpR family regulator
VNQASDGLAGLVELDRRLPDLLLVDVAVPKLDGISLVRALRGRPQTRRLPVIFLSAEDDTPERVIEGMNLGAKFYLRKPIELAELRAKVREALA